MLIKPAEESFQNGMKALSSQDPRTAMAFFEAAIKLERQFGVLQHQARYLSFYGLCLALTGRRVHEGVRFCRLAVDLDEIHPEIHWNLGRVLLVADRRRQAYKSFMRGLRLHPGHTGIVGSLKQMGLRRAPVVRFLPRSNPINVLLGKLRHARWEGAEQQA